MEKFKGLFIEGTKSGYTPEQCDETFTIDNLIEKLNKLKKEYGGDIPVYMYSDNGYTYGHINEDTINIGDYSETDGLVLTITNSKSN